VKRIHLLRTEAGPETVAGLIAAAREAGLRIGWLDLEGAPPVAPLDAAAEAGALRAVAVGSGRTVAVKRAPGPPVLRDLLREHFLGCALVVIRSGAGDPETEAGPRLAPGELVDVPLLEPTRQESPGGWRVGSTLELTTAELVARLRRPRPW
jgi:hypothetical protein